MQRSATSSSTFALWSTMHDTGRFKTETNAETRDIILELEGFASPSPELCTITGNFIEESLRMSGHTLVVTKEGCTLWGDPCYRWKAK